MQLIKAANDSYLSDDPSEFKPGGLELALFNPALENAWHECVEIARFRHRSAFSFQGYAVADPKPGGTAPALLGFAQALARSPSGA